MSESYFELAEKLAERPYSIMKFRDETTDGAPIYLARALEIENCFGPGDTPEEAEQDLRRKSAQNIATWAKTGRPDYIVVRGTKRPPGI